MIGMGEILVILCVVLLLFGGKRLPDFAKNLGKGIREFKNACQGVEESSSSEKSSCCCSTEKPPLCDQNTECSQTKHE